MSARGKHDPPQPGARQAKRRRDRRARRARTLAKWAAAIAVLALVVYAVSQTSGVAYTDRDIGVVDFSVLTGSQKRQALQAANRARCTCSCGMTLAQCVATDTTCPVRSDNIDRIKRMVQDAIKAQG
jgi:hypothetical protein